MKIRTTSRFFFLTSGAGFTILEVLTSLVIGIVIVLLGFGIIHSNSETFRKSTGKIDTLVETRTLVHYISNDAATAHRNLSFQYSTQDTEINFAFLTFKPVSAQDSSKASGDLCLVQYFTDVNSEVPGSPPSRKLYRRLISSADIASQLRENTVPTLPDPDPNAEGAEPIVFNIAQILFEPLVLSQGNSEGGSTSSSYVTWTESLGKDPITFHITLHMIDDKIAKILRNTQDWKLQTPISKKMFGDQKLEHFKNRKTETASTKHGYIYHVTVPFG